jgi:acyl dehydratase
MRVLGALRFEQGPRMTTLPEWRLPITPTLVVSTAVATRDFQDVHHDRDLARSYGSQDIFLNILTTTGLVQRYVTDALRSAGLGDVELAGIALRLGAPAYPGDELVFTGTRDGDTVTVVGAVSIGDHVTATVTLR